MRVKKIYNNSVVLGVDDTGRDAILIGSGIGFSLSPGMEIDPSRVERTFVPDDPEALSRAVSLAQTIPPADITLTEKIVQAASEQLGVVITENLFIPLADHLSFALRRAREGTAEVDYPLRWEVQQLYPEEVRFATSALRLVKEHSGVDLPAVEIVPIALHFVNAQLGSGDISTAMQMTEVMTEALQIVAQRFSLHIEETSLPVARLVTHLRYLFLRQQRGTQNQSVHLPFDAEIRAALPAEQECAIEIAALLERRWQTHITSEETLYLTLHIGRMTATLRDEREDGPA